MIGVIRNIRVIRVIHDYRIIRATTRDNIGPKIIRAVRFARII
jgi:hypothetical protein